MWSVDYIRACSESKLLTIKENASFLVLILVFFKNVFLSHNILNMLAVTYTITVYILAPHHMPISMCWNPLWINNYYIILLAQLQQLLILWITQYWSKEGSALGSFLLIIYINSVDQNVSNFHFYANDTVIYCSAFLSGITCFNTVRCTLCDLKLVFECWQNKTHDDFKNLPFSGLCDCVSIQIPMILSFLTFSNW